MMKPADGRKALYAVSGLFLAAFFILLGADWYVWGHGLHSAPFYLRALERCLEFLLLGGVVFLAARASRRKRGRTACTGMLALLAAVMLVTAPAGLRNLPGAPREDAFLRGYAVSEDGGSLTLEMDLASSAGYLRAVDSREEGGALYLTFYGTRGINNPNGARDSFSIPLPEGCREIHIWGQGGAYRLALQKDAAGRWWEPA
ncbi:MAG: hypothetical protein Q4C45_06575 [Oscillospiraceae bacterium]|nr:hypothetical protein [Oscillospiraceae bacterium]